MARPAKDDRARLMRACRAVGLDEEARHDMQMAVTGKASMRDMGGADLRRLLDRLNSAQGQGGKGAGHRHPTAPRADLRLIHALWSELGRKGALNKTGRAGLNAFIRARFGAHWSFIPVDVDALTDTGCITDVIRALKAMLARAEAGETNGGEA